MTRRRLGEFDPVEALSGVCPPVVSQVIFGILCFGAVLLTRAFVDIFATGAGPFSLIYPAILISTLYGRWQAGLLTFVLSFLHAWYFVLPETHSFAFANSTDQSRTIVNGSAALVILIFAESFRFAVHHATRQRDKEMETQEVLMRELEHRTKNNFAMVAGLLTMQQRASTSPEVQEALLSAAARVRSFSAIHETIYASDSFSAEVPLQAYLKPLIQQLAEGLFENGKVRIELNCDPVNVPRDRTVAIGLIVAELVTNAAKHAFPDRNDGVITVSYTAPAGALWCLTVCDDGRGSKGLLETANKPPSGLGSQLLQAFATTAGGQLTTEHTENGTCVKLVEDPQSFNGASTDR